jgi:hypothetical protein
LPVILSWLVGGRPPNGSSEEPRACCVTVVPVLTA